jgi:hypothetical protein
MEKLELELFGTSSCSLCDKAEAILGCLLAEGYDWCIEQIDIVDDDASLAKYALSIPVLRKVSGGEELCWPFDPKEVVAFIKGV